jgi:short-subunit dehydrogenase
MRLRNRVAVVTGAASGIGRALCPLLAQEGARLGLLDRNAEGLASLAEELRAKGVCCATASADVRDRRATREAIEALAGQLGPVDLLVACAGITGTTLVDDLAVEETEAILRVNLLGVAHAIDAVLPGMLARRGGQIVALSSLAGCRGMPFSAAYSASKAALAAYLESLRPALRRRGIAVTTVFPGFVRTPLMQSAAVQPPVPMLEPEQAARYVLHAILRRRRVYSFPWSTSLAVRFLSWLPAGVYDWMMARGAAKIPNLRY